MSESKIVPREPSATMCAAAMNYLPGKFGTMQWASILRRMYDAAPSAATPAPACECREAKYDVDCPVHGENATAVSAPDGPCKACGGVGCYRCDARRGPVISHYDDERGEWVMMRDSKRWLCDRAHALTPCTPKDCTWPQCMHIAVSAPDVAALIARLLTKTDPALGDADSAREAGERWRVDPDCAEAAAMLRTLSASEAKAWVLAAEWKDKATHWNDPLGAASLSTHETKTWRERAETLEMSVKRAERLAAERGERIAELEKDAARYRWLRDVGDGLWLAFKDRPGYSKAACDANVDAAIAESALAPAAQDGASG